MPPMTIMVASNNPTRRSSWGLKPLDSPSAVEDFGAGWTVLKRDTPVIPELSSFRQKKITCEKLLS